MEEQKYYIPPGWIRFQIGGKVIFRTDCATCRITIRSRGQLQELRVLKKRFLGDDFKPIKLCFTKKPEMEQEASSRVDILVEDELKTSETSE